MSISQNLFSLLSGQEFEFCGTRNYHRVTTSSVTIKRPIHNFPVHGRCTDSNFCGKRDCPKKIFMWVKLLLSFFDLSFRSPPLSLSKKNPLGSATLGFCRGWFGWWWFTATYGSSGVGSQSFVRTESVVSWLVLVGFGFSWVSRRCWLSFVCGCWLFWDLGEALGGGVLLPWRWWRW